VLTLRVSTSADRADAVARAMGEIGGVHRVVAADARSAGAVVFADVDTDAADHVLVVLEDLGIPADDYVLARLHVVAPVVHRGARAQDEGFAWAEVLGEARASARSPARYVAFMAVAGVIAAFGVIDRSEILIVGAMAVAPDLMPVCATAVAIVGRRPRLAAQALFTLVIGMALVAGVAAVLSSVLAFLAVIENDFVPGVGFLGGLKTVDYSTVIVALAAGVAAMMAFETRASAAVGVAISVTTIPASAFMGVAVGVGQSDEALGALGVLVTNIACLILAGTVTLVVRRAAQPNL
jgi:uncharacterized hydrophobic protein (TIGR00271 family)